MKLILAFVASSLLAHRKTTMEVWGANAAMNPNAGMEVGGHFLHFRHHILIVRPLLGPFEIGDTKQSTSAAKTPIPLPLPPAPNHENPCHKTESAPGSEV